VQQQERDLQAIMQRVFKVQAQWADDLRKRTTAFVQATGGYARVERIIEVMMEEYERKLEEENGGSAPTVQLPPK